MSATAAPWTAPPARTKKLRTRKAERTARKAEYWGQRMDNAQQQGPEAVAAVQFDRARVAFRKLPDETRWRAFEDLARAIDRIREIHAE